MGLVYAYMPLTLRPRAHRPDDKRQFTLYERTDHVKDQILST